MSQFHWESNSGRDHRESQTGNCGEGEGETIKGRP
jgi:hypothetical protein